MRDPAKAFQPPLICVADVDTRLTCSCYCAVCPYHIHDRRVGERRAAPRRTRERRTLNRLQS